MSNKDVKVYFLGNKLGHSYHKLFPSKMTNKRKYEESAFFGLDGIKRTHFINKADILFFRNRGATTTDNMYHSLSNRVNDKKFIINDIRSFLNYDSKDKSFSIWAENGLKCPACISFTLDEINKINSIDRIKEFQKKHGKILIRTNNETGSKGLFVIENPDKIDKVLDKLRKRVSLLIQTRKDTKIICVQYINANHSDNLHRLYRVHILFDKVLSYYVTTSTRNEFHNADMRIKDAEPFIAANTDFQNILPTIKETLIKAVEVLGCNIGALEFFLVNGEPYFLELNPIWGGHASRGGFGDKEMMNYLESKKAQLIKDTPNIYKWLDYSTYYSRMYRIIRDHYIDNL